MITRLVFRQSPEGQNLGEIEFDSRVAIIPPLNALVECIGIRGQVVATGYEYRTTKLLVVDLYLKDVKEV